MNSIGTSSNEAGQPSLKQPALKGWARRTGLLPWLLPLLAVAIVAAGVGWAGLSAPVQAQGTMDYDQDNDSLIEVSNLAQLDAIRWDLDGKGSASSSLYQEAFPDAAEDMGCPDGSCSGYELTTNLDFDTDGDGAVDADDELWYDGAGWVPIGRVLQYNIPGVPLSEEYEGKFEGNGHSITNLYINRGDRGYVGLFGVVGSNGSISNLGLPSVNVAGGSQVGSLAGGNAGTITKSLSTIFSGLTP